MELLEDRTAPAILPPAVINNTGATGPATTVPITVSTTTNPVQLPGASPSVAQNPLNPAKLIEVHTNGTQLVASYSTNGGTTWNGMVNVGTGSMTILNEIDISTNSRYPNIDHATVAMDRGDNVYITAVQHDAANTSGALVFYRFNFSGGTPTGGGSQILQRWLNADPIFNPVVAVNNNVALFTDPTHTDNQAALSGGFAKGLFVAWNTNDTAPSPLPIGIGTFNPNVIRVMGSSDGGANWTSPQIVNFEGYFNNGADGNPGSSRYATPQMIFTQGSADGVVAGGALVFAWNDFVNNQILVDFSQPDGGNAGDPSPHSRTFTGSAGGVVTEASARVSGATISNAGSGYAIGNILTVVGNAGTIGTAATLRVANVGGSGDITAIAVQTAGAYTVRPANAVSVTGGTGTGATFNLTYQGNTPDAAVTTSYTNSVSISDPNFRVHDLELTISLIHPQLHQLQLELVSPGGAAITLVHNRTNELGQTVDQNNVNIAASGNPAAGVPTGRANFGDLSNGADFGTTFSDNAARLITDAAVAAPYTARFRPESAAVMNRSGIAGLLGTDAAISGNWTLRIIDHRNDGTTAPEPLATQRLDSWSLRFSDVSPSTYVRGGFGDDGDASTNDGEVRVPGATTIAGAFNGVYGQAGVAPFGTGGVGPSISLAVDNTVGSFSPYQGRVYIAYTAAVAGTPATNTDVWLVTGDFTSSTNISWSTSVRVNDDAAIDNFSEGVRAQFMPTLAVDQTTGTLAITYYDARYDAANMRAATALTTSIDGGQTFANVVYVNQMKTALDAIDFTKLHVIEPIPGNQGGITFGDRQGLVANNGRIVPVFSSNQNTSSAILLTAIVNVAAGPRIIAGDGGPVLAMVGGLNPIGADGRQLFNAFELTFDRPVDPTTFTASDVTVIYRDPHGTDTTLSVLSVTALDGPFYTVGARTIGSAANPLATRFRVQLTNTQSGAGTYRYYIGSDIADRMRTVLNTGDGSLTANFVDQDNDADSNESSTTDPASQDLRDEFRVPNAASVRLGEQLPLMLSGPFVVDTSVPVNPFASDNLVLNGLNSVVDVTFDRDVLASSFTPADIIAMIGLGGPIPGPFTVTPLSSRTFRIGFNPQALSGTYSIQIGPNIEEANEQQRIVIPGANTTSVTFSFNGVQAASPLAYVFGATTPAAVQANLETIAALAGNILVSGPPGGAYTVTFINGLANQEVASLITIDAYTYTGPTGTDPTVAEVTPRLDINRNAGLQAIGLGPVSATTVQVEFPSPNIPVTLTPGQTVTSLLSIADIFAIQQSQASHIQLQLSITHQNIPDLEAQLIAPDGTTIQLFNGVGVFGSAPNANMNGTIFDDFAPNLIQNASTPIPAGPFTPQLPLSVLNGKLSNGAWTLAITNHGTLSGRLTAWTLFLPRAAPDTGLGELVADRFSAHFRIFTQDPANELTTTTWTAVGPAPHGIRSSRIGGIAVDPSDPSGNTVFVAGASGGVWKTRNFLTTDASGPTWTPLTDFGPTFAINVGSIAVFGRSNDPDQSIVFVATGEGDTGTPGVGLIRSMDGGRTWQVLDSRNNVDVANPANPADPDKIAKMSSTNRDHAFFGLTSYKVIVDPQAQPNGQVAVYMALGNGANQGVWRSLDTGKTWTRIRAGFATDVTLASGSRDAGGNLDKLYAAFIFGSGGSSGVYFTSSARSATSMTQLLGDPGVHPLFRDVDNPAGDVPIPVTPALDTPNGDDIGRTILAVPALANEPLKDTLYQGWVYALVAVPGGGIGSSGNAGGLHGLYLSKDFGQNWTKIKIPALNGAIPTNNETRLDYNILGNQGNYDLSLIVDPNDPNVVYVGGQAEAGGSVIRVDVTTLADPYALVPYDNGDLTVLPGQPQFSTTGAASLKRQGLEYGLLGPLRPGAPINANPQGYFNLLRDPDKPFDVPASLQFTNVARFNNLGDDVLWTSFSGPLQGSVDQHEIAVMIDPTTGLTRVIFGDDSGIYSGIGRPVGTRFLNTSSLTRADGTNVKTLPNGSRNGNLQISQFYYGAAQPSVLAADIAGAMFYGMAQDTGFPRSTQDVIATGNLTWSGSLGDGAGVATDQTGSGTSYEYRWPCCGAGPLKTDFFFIDPPIGPMVSRTTGLVLPGDDPANNVGQWPLGGEGNFAINPIDGTALVISSPTSGRIFRTVGPSTGSGKQWFEIGIPGAAFPPAGASGNVDANYKKALAFGSPRSAVPGATSDFIYAGSVRTGATAGGRIFVTFSGGGPNGWRNISNGLDGSNVQAIVPNPRIDSREAYAVTRNRVFWLADAQHSAANPTWVDITGNLFALTAPVFGLVADQNQQLRYIESLAVDWRYAIPDDLGDPTGPTHPVLYVAGEGGVFRSIDKGVTWVPFPNGTDERQLITVSPTVTSLTFSYNGAAAPALAFTPTITAAQIRTRLSMIPALNGNISVTGAVGGPYTVRFINGLAKSDVAPITVNPSGIVPAGEIVTVVEATRGVPQGGYIPNGHVSDLDLVLGNIDPNTGFPNEAAGLNMLVAFTYGRGAFAIRLDNSDVEQFVVSPRFGPRVVSAQNGPVGSGGIDTTWSGPVDKVSFTTADLVQNERQTITLADPTEVTFDFNAVPATSPLFYTAATTAAQVQDHLVTIPALFTNEQQSILIPSSVSTVTFSFNSIAATSPLIYSAGTTTAADVQAHLELIPALLGNIVVTGVGIVADPFLVEFINALHGKDVPLLTANNGAVVINEPRKGGPNIRVTGVAGGPFDVTFIHGLAGQDVPQLNPTVANGGPVGVVQTLQGSVPAKMLNPAGVDIVPVNIVETSSGNPNPHNVFRILLPGPLSPGFYTFTLGPNVSDFSGNKMDQDRDVFNKGEISDDMFSGRVLYQNFTNDRPTLNPGAYPFLPDIVEDDFSSPGTDLATFIASLGVNIGDPNDGLYAAGAAPRGIAVTGVDNANGRWQYAIDVYDSNPLWIDFGTPTAATARLLEASSATRIRFVPNPDYAGPATFTFEAWDLTVGTPGATLDVSAAGVSSSSYSIPTNGTSTAILTVTAVNDAPVNIVPAPQSTIEETSLIFSAANGNRIAVSDVDLTAGNQTLQVTLTVTAGVLTLNGIAGLDFGFAADANGAPVGDGTADATMTFRGTLADINAALDGLDYLPNLNFTGAETLTIGTNDLGNFGTGGALTDSDTVAITVTQVNDAPVNTVPGAQFIDEDTPLVFATGGGNLISIADVDDNDDSSAGNEPMQVTLAVTNGVMSLNGTAGLIFAFADANGTGAGDGTADVTMTFRGTRAAINTALDGMRYIPTTNFNVNSGNLAVLTITTNDRGNFGTGGALTDTDTVEITVNPINDAPLLNAGPSPSLTPIAEDPSNPAGNTVASIVVDGSITEVVLDNAPVEAIAVVGVNTTNGVWEYSIDAGSSWIDFVAPTIAAARLLRPTDMVRFIPNTNFNGTATFTFRAWDMTSGTAGSVADTTVNGGITPFSVNTDTATITVTPVNDAPLLDAAASPALSAIPEDTAAPAGDTIAAIIVNGSITEVPLDNAPVEAIAVIGVDNTNGVWQFSTNGGTTWAPFGAPTVAAARLLGPANVIRFIPNTNFNGTATFTFRAWDVTTGSAGGTADTTINGGSTAFSTITDTAAITITPVNDAPLLDAGPSPTLTTIDEDPTNPAGNTVAAIVVDGSITEVPLDNAPVEAIAVVGVDNSNGAWQFSTNGGSTWTSFGTPTVAVARLLGPANLVRFVPNTNYNGSSSFTFRAWDMTSGTAGGTANTTTNGGITAFSTATDTASIIITPVNDAPLLDAAASPVLTAIPEDTTNPAGDTVAAIIVNGSITEVPLDNAAVEAIAVIGVDDSNGVWQYSTDGGGAWSSFGAVTAASARLLGPADMVRFIPNTNFNGTATFTFRAWDVTTGSAGSTADTSVNGGSTAFSTATDTAAITVTPVNDAPLLDAGASPALSAILEDAANPAGNTVAAIVVDGSITEVPLDNAAVEAIAVTGVDNTNGAWQYSTNGGGAWTAFGAPSVSAARLLTSTHLIRFIPNVNFNGPVAFTFRAWDMTTGTAGGTADTTINGGVTAFSTTTDTASITITPINDEPVRTSPAAAPVTADEDAANSSAASLNLGSLNYAPGPASAIDELANQTLSYQIAAIPSVVTIFLADGTTQVFAGSSLADLNALRTLRFKTVPNANGSGVLTWTVTDSEIGTPPPNDNSLTDGMSINITAVNDAPTFNLTPTTSSNEDAPLQTVNGFASSMSVGPANESPAQSLVGFTLTPTGTTGGLTFAIAPAINVLTGALTYRAAANANGAATYNVVLTDSGSNVSPNVNTSAPQSFTITVVAVNDAPSFTKGPDQIVRKDSLPQTVSNWATAISQDQGLPTHQSESGQALDFIVNASNPGLFLVQPAIDAAGNLTYTPLAGISGASQVTVQLHDDGGVLNGGSNTSAAQTFNISVTDGTTTTLSASSSSSVIGQSVTLSALVQSNNPTNLIPDGTVTFVDTTNSITLAANVPVDANGQATVVVNSLVLGAHTLTATYSGSSGFTGSSDSEAHQVSAADTTVALSASASSTVLTQNVTFTATVTVNAPGSAANLSPAGSVEFFDVTTNTLLANVPLSGGQAQFSTSSLALGDHNIRATFQSSNSNFNDSADTELHTVNPNPVVFIAVPSSVKSGVPFTVVVYYLKNGVPDATFNGPITLGVNTGTPGGGITGQTVVNASGGIATFAGIRINRAGTYTLKANAAGLPEVISSPIDITAILLSLQVSPRVLIINRPITMVVTAQDILGLPAPNFNGPFVIKVLKKPAGARITNRFGIFNGGVAVLNNLRVNKAGTYKFQITINGLTVTKTFVIRGRRSSSA